MKQSKEVKESSMEKPINVKDVKRSSVTIKKVENGFIVRGCKDDHYESEKEYVFMTEAEAKAQAAKML